ncbi:thioredoxin family protein [Flavobacterium silvaticum]|uniref:Thioredoxin family protein n=1 Tax=Flavobacterium silvaticum TaxID=1852020 RepID=A0A972JGS1_9FLAO|nr:thioredoxin family protein [Flavobacterium silvaticum]NMH27180.1 thioredoxin family protein [Flavobacterium silvaticum]
MKKILLILLFIVSPMLIQAQELKWYTNLDEAVKVSEKSKKPLLLFFTGSDWCGWCIRLQNEVLKTPEFTAWAKENVVLVELDFPRRTPQPDAIRNQNAQLQQFFGVRGYPTVWFAKANFDKTANKMNFEQLGKTGYVAGGPAAWLQGANQIIKKT